MTEKWTPPKFTAATKGGKPVNQETEAYYNGRPYKEKKFTCEYYNPNRR